MRRLVSILVMSCLALLALSFAQETILGIPIAPVSVEFDDADFDYFDKEEAYIHVSRDANVLTIYIDDAATPDALMLEYDEVDAPDDDDIKAERLAHHKDALRAYAGIDVSFQGVEMTFKDTYLEDVVDHFNGLLSDLNFTPVVESASGNTFVYDCGCNIDPDFHLRVVYTWVAGETFVSIKAN